MSRSLTRASARNTARGANGHGVMERLRARASRSTTGVDARGEKRRSIVSAVADVASIQSVRSLVTVGHFDGSRTVKPLRWTVEKSHREDVDDARRRTERVIERWIDVIVLRVTPGNSIPPPEVD